MASDAIRLEREKRKTRVQERQYEREQMVLDRLLTPNMTRLALVTAIIAYSTYCARSRQNVGPVQSALAFALPGIGLPIIAADAGITDKYALAAISAAGVGYTGLSMVEGWKDVGLVPGASQILDAFSQLGAAPAASLQQFLSALNPFD